MTVDLRDVGACARIVAAMSIGSSTCVTIFDGSGTFGGMITLIPNGKPMLIGRMLSRNRLIEAKPLGQTRSAA